jgi:hypothetical protein
MESQSYRPILKRVGSVLLVVGLLDVAVMIYCIVNRLSYRSSLVFGLIFGIFLMRGSLRAAATIRWFCVFFLSACIVGILAWPAIQPIDLTLMQIRLKPAAFAGGVASLALAVVLFKWIISELGREPIRVASKAAGLKSRDMRLPVAVGIALVIGIAVSSNFFLKGESAERAKSMAEREVGSGYKLHVSSLRISTIDRRKSVSAVVTAWNDREIREIPVRWEETGTD